MGKYDERLSQLTQSDIVARLEGPGGLLAVSNRELFYLDSNTQQTAPLYLIKRISVNKQTGTVDVMGEQGTLIAIAPAAFQKDELKLFLESLKEHVIRAKSDAPRASEAPKTLDSVETASSDRGFSTPPPQPPAQRVPPAASDLSPSSAQASTTEAVKPSPDEASAPSWAYEAPSKPSAAEPTTRAQATKDLTPPTSPASKSSSSTQRLVSVLLKVSALVTASVTAGYLVANTSAASDIWVPLGVMTLGLSLALIQWRLSEP